MKASRGTYICNNADITLNWKDIHNADMDEIDRHRFARLSIGAAGWGKASKIKER